MIKVLQYGEGNFLRGFADVYFDILNETTGSYEVHVVKPRPGGCVDAFHRQQNRYHVILRGMEGGKCMEQVRRINILKQVIHPFQDPDSYYALARDPELKLIVSNTTDAGIRFQPEDSFVGFEAISFPAKLTKFLYVRFLAGLGGVYLLPVELIENNADRLLECVESYIRLWNLPDAFRKWNREENFYCNTLVDRIVSGYPRDAATQTYLESLIGGEDPLMTVGEPFGLWVVERKGDIERYLSAGKHGIEMILTGDVTPYKVQKVRILNGSHTNLVATGLLLGAKTVRDCMDSEVLRPFIERTLREELIPMTPGSEDFAESVIERFCNPYLNHQLTSIALNSISKWTARVLPTFRDYYAANGTIPPCMTVGFSYLMALYSSVRREGGGYVAPVCGEIVELLDNPAYLDFFADGGKSTDFMAMVSVWGEDLTQYPNFSTTVAKNIDRICKGECLI